MQAIKDRISALRAEMTKNGMQAYVVPSADPHLSEYTPAHWQARHYFSGFTGSAGTLVVTEKKSGLWTDGRYFIQAEKQLAGSDIELFRMGVKGVPTFSQFLVKELGEKQTVGLDGRLFSAADIGRIRKILADKKLQIKSADLIGPLWPDRPPLPNTEVFPHDTEYAGYTCAEKLAQVRAELKKYGADGQLYARLDCVAWLLNIRAGDVEGSPFAVAYAAVLPDSAFLFIDSSRVPAPVRENLAQNGVQVRGYEEIGAFADSLGKKKMLANPAGTSWELYERLSKNAGVTVIDGPDIVYELKSIRNETEIRNLREVHIRDGCAQVEAFTELERQISEGYAVTEWTVCTLLKEARARQKDNRGESFGTIAAYGANAAMMHYAPKPDSCSKLERRGFLLVDSGGQYLGGTTDITRTFALGPLTQEEKECYTRVLKSHIALATAVFLEGTAGGGLDTLCREPLWQVGIDYRCGTGHGVGNFGNVHEGPPNIRPKNGTVLKKGMTVTDEPGVYTEGRFGIRTENLMLVDEAFENEYGKFLRFEVVTCFPIDTTPVLPEMLTDAELAWLNRYNTHVRETLMPMFSGRELSWLLRRTEPLQRGERPQES